MPKTPATQPKRSLPPSPVPIVQKDDPVLRLVAAEIPPADITSPRIRDIIKRMNAALDSQEDGVAIAAPQIGESVRIFIVSKRAFELVAEAEEKAPRSLPKQNLVFINPRITRRSKQTALMDEGCLSVRFLYGSVRRAVKVSVEALDEYGKPFSYNGSGLMAEIFQHECDHLEGILFIDSAKNVRELPLAGEDA